MGQECRDSPDADAAVPSLDRLECRDDDETSAALGGDALGRLDLTGDGEPERLASEQGSCELRPAAVILYHGLWQRRFGGDPAILGSAITLDGEPWTVVGIPVPIGATADAARWSAGPLLGRAPWIRVRARSAALRTFPATRTPRASSVDRQAEPRGESERVRVLHDRQAGRSGEAAQQPQRFVFA